MSSDLTSEKIAELAGAPKSTSTDEGQVVERTMKDIIDADRYVKSSQVGCKPPFGLCIAKIRPPSAV